MRKIGLCCVVAVLVLTGGCQGDDPGTFETPEQAIQALSAIAGQGDDAQIEAIFGPGSVELFRSGDDAADREDAARVKTMIEYGVEFVAFDENTRIALLGEAAWPWPIPLVRVGGGWQFSAEDGREELLNRRIGRNELWTLTAMHEIVDAQREYGRQTHDGNPRAYAKQFLSSEGKRDGLYWPVDDGENPSPLGELLADSEAHRPSPKPFHGYLYRMLTRQGENAAGGARDYLDTDGHLTGGFGVIAWPAKYGNSGVMTFVTNRLGIVYQKDLGTSTEVDAAAIETFNPDPSWHPTPDRMRDIEQP